MPLSLCLSSWEEYAAKHQGDLDALVGGQQDAAMKKYRLVSGVNRDTKNVITIQQVIMRTSRIIHITYRM